MTTAVVTTLSSAPYTWASLATKTWASPEAGKSWAGAATFEYKLDVSEPVNAMSVGGRHSSKPFSELFGANDGDSIKRNLVLNHLAQIGLSESYSDNIAFLIRVSESIAVTDLLQKQTGLTRTELFGVTSSGFRKQLSLSLKEATGFAETFGRVVRFSRAYAESADFKSATGKAMSLSKKEAFAAFDEYIRHGNAVLSDMLLTSEEITFEGFKQILDGGMSPGYAPFRDFIPGDYEYQFALFRAVLESSNSERARLTQLRLDVDVPDVIETGTAVIVNGATGLRVNFIRVFHIIPEITMNLRGGTVIAIPDYVEKDKLGFTVILRRIPDDVRVPGTVTWAAHGY